MFVFNICTETASGDRYKEVAINQYPMIFFGTHEELYELLASDRMIEYVRSEIPSRQIYDKSVYKIRELDGEELVRQFDIAISEVTKL